jgi:trimeric autotransporter adhesin
MPKILSGETVAGAGVFDSFVAFKARVMIDETPQITFRVSEMPVGLAWMDANSNFGMSLAATQSTGTGSIFLGTGAGDTATSGDGNVFVGTQARGNAANTAFAIAVGHTSRAATNAVSIGYASAASATGAVAVGQGASGGGTVAVAVGSGSQASASYATALGRSTKANFLGSVAIGCDSGTTGAQALAADDFMLGTLQHHVKVPGTLQTANTGQLWVGYDTDAMVDTAGITFGLSKDANLYRSAAGTLRSKAVVIAPRMLTNTPSLDPFTGSSSFSSVGPNLTPNGQCTGFLFANVCDTLSGNAVYGFYSRPTLAATASPTYAAGIRIDNPILTAGAAPTNVYGMMITPQSGGTTQSIGISIGECTTAAIHLGPSTNATTMAAGIAWGFAKDANLYRGGNGILKSDYDFQARRLGIGGVHDAIVIYTVGSHPSTAPTTYGIYSGLTFPATTTNCTSVVAAPYVAAGAAMVSVYGMQINAPIMGTDATAIHKIGLVIGPHNGATGTNVGISVAEQGTAALWLGSNVNSTTVAGGIVFGLAKDTNLYRVAASTLATDGGFLFNSTLKHAGSTFGVFNVTPAGQYSGTTGVTGWAVGTGTAALAGSTSTGGLGTAAYTFSDVVRVLKQMGFLRQT